MQLRLNLEVSSWVRTCEIQVENLLVKMGKLRKRTREKEKSC